VSGGESGVQRGDGAACEAGGVFGDRVQCRVSKLSACYEGIQAVQPGKSPCGAGIRAFQEGIFAFQSGMASCRVGDKIVSRHGT